MSLTIGFLEIKVKSRRFVLTICDCECNISIWVGGGKRTITLYMEYLQIHDDVGAAS